MRMVDFGQMMRKYRMRHGLTQEALGEILGVDTKYIGFLENRHRFPGPGLQMRFEALLLVDEWSSELMEQECMMTEDERQILLTFYQKLHRLHPSKCQSAVDLTFQLLDGMTTER